MKWNAWWMDSFKKKISFNFPLERIKLSLLLLDLSLIPNAQPTITVVSGWETTYPQVFFRKLRSCVSCACLTLSLPCLQRCHFHNDQWRVKLKIDKPFFLPYYIILKCSYHIFAIFVVTFSFVEKNILIVLIVSWIFLYIQDSEPVCRLQHSTADVVVHAAEHWNVHLLCCLSAQFLLHVSHHGGSCWLGFRQQQGGYQRLSKTCWR